MGCTSCQGNKKPSEASKVRAAAQQTVTKANATMPLEAGKSDTPARNVRLRYFGGEYQRVSTGGGCSSCRGNAGQYTLTTNETIMFPSEDEPKGLFTLNVSIGRDYYVTQKQAEYMLQMTYVNRGGQKVHKFKRIN